MRIGIDISRYFDRSGGVGIYAANLLKYLLKIDKNNEYNAYSFFYNCFPSNWKYKKIIDEFRKYGKVNFSQINLPPSILKRKWNNASIEKKEKLLGGVDIIHSTAYVIPELFNARLVVTIHDLSFLIFPEYHTIEKYGLTGKYLLCVASIEPRKNFLRIINAFSEFIKQEEYKEYSLVCVGGRGWKNIEIYSLVKQKNLEGKIKFLRSIEECELAPIYNQAEIFLYPSLYEGFGLPVLEAMACAVPVITSNVSSLPEVASGAAILVNPYSEKQIYKAILHLVENKNKREQLIDMGLKNIKKFSWENTAKQTLNLYQQIYKKYSNRENINKMDS